MNKIGLIIQREFYERVKKKSFIITTLLMPLLMIGLMVVPVLLAIHDTSDEKQILVVDRSGLIVQNLQNTDKLTFVASDKTPDELRAEKKNGTFGFLVIGADVIENPSDIQLYSYEPSTMDIETSIGSQIRKVIEDAKLRTYDIENLPQIMAEVKTKVSISTFRLGEDGSEKASSSGLSFGIAYAFGFLIYIFVFIYGGMVMQGVVEEKSSKVLEVIVSSVKPFQLMLGKIFGIAAVALTQFLIWVVLLVAGGSALMAYIEPDASVVTEMAQGATMGIDVQQAASQFDPDTVAMLKTVTDIGYMVKLLGGFVLFFIGGYLLYAAMFAAVGSAVDNTADTQQLQLPVSIPLILAIVVLMSAMKDPNGSLAFWFSLVPFTSPVIMMARIPYGVPFWQIALSIAILYASFVAMVWFAGKIYRVGIFMYGKKPSLKEVIKWSKYKY